MTHEPAAKSFTKQSNLAYNTCMLCSLTTKFTGIRLATAVRSRIGINRWPCEKISWHWLWSCTIWLPFLILCAHIAGPKNSGGRWGYSPRVIIPNFASLGQTIWVKVGVLKNFGNGTWLTRRYTVLCHVCYRTKFGRFRSDRMGICRGSQNYGDYRAPSPLDVVMSDPRFTLVPTFYHTKSRCCRSRYFGVDRGPKKFGGCWGLTPLGICFSPPVLPCLIRSF